MISAGLAQTGSSQPVGRWQPEPLAGSTLIGPRVEVEHQHEDDRGRDRGHERRQVEDDPVDADAAHA